MSETIHNIWLQRSGKCARSLFVVTFDDYVRTFGKYAYYRVYLNGGRCREGPVRDELRLWQTNQSSDPSQMANAIIKYIGGSSFTTRIPHLEGQEVFGSTKQRVNIASRSEGDSHKHDHVNFSRPRIKAMSSGFIGSNIDVGKSNGIVRDEAFVLIFQGLKVQECVYGDGVWRIERCPPSSNTHCFAIQRDSMKHCNTIIITIKTVHGILGPCYNGLWFDLKGSTPIRHKFWFCANDWNHYVGGTRGIVSIGHLSHQCGQCK